MRPLPSGDATQLFFLPAEQRLSEHSSDGDRSSFPPPHLVQMRRPFMGGPSILPLLTFLFSLWNEMS